MNRVEVAKTTEETLRFLEERLGKEKKRSLVALILKQALLLIEGSAYYEQ